jgi:hypothetical protein
VLTTSNRFGPDAAPSSGRWAGDCPRAIVPDDTLKAQHSRAAAEAVASGAEAAPKRKECLCIMGETSPEDEFIRSSGAS